MKVYERPQIKAEDYEKEYSQLITQLGEILNPFMRDVVDITDNRIDFENRVESYKQVEFTVDASGKPILNNKLNTGKTTIRGFQVINAVNLTNPAVLVTEQPFIIYSPIGGGVVQINKITGLVANNKFLLNIIMY